MIDGYYNRYDPNKDYDEHLFRAGYVLQSAELNEVQSAAKARLASIGDALFKDGDVVRDAQVVVDKAAGTITCEPGAIYVDGAVRGVKPATFTIPMAGIVVIGVYLQRTVITELEDPDLRDPASLTRNYVEPGAARLKVEAVWGYSGDGSDGEFYSVYTVENGDLLAKEPPPNLDAFTQSLARYDRDSSGGSYVVSGLRVTKQNDLATGEQVYTVSEGRARVNGYGVEVPTSRRVVYPAEPDLRLITSEPKASTTASAQRIDVDRAPIGTISSVQITEEKTVTLTHGNFTGAQDPLPDTSVVEIIEVKQGETVYTQGVDYRLTSGRVDWSLSGTEPSTGSTYQCTYRFINTVTPTDVDDEGFTVTGAVPGTLILTTYTTKLPRIDRLCINEEGRLIWIKGVATDYNPVRPQVPGNVLDLAQIYQSWTADRVVTNDGTRMVPMDDIESISARLVLLTDLVAQQKLVSDIGTRETSAQKGLFVDPFFGDDARDQGTPQTGAVFGGVLTLPISANALSVSDDVSEITTCDYNLVPILSQSARTGSMKINPYMAFDVPPREMELTPAVDRWTETTTTWESAITERFVLPTLSLGWSTRTTTTTDTRTLSTTTERISNLRQIDVQFRVTGFGPNEAIQSLTFDGIEVTPTAI